MYLQHSIIFNDNDIINKDTKERNFADYLKYIFLTSDNKLEKAYTIIEESNNRFDYDLVTARLIYPGYYLYFLLNKKYDYIIKIVNTTEEYENYVNNIVQKINYLYNKKIVLPF